jgi:hypothetical protein
MDIAKYRKDSESFLSRMDKEHYLHFSGQKDSLNLSPIYDRYGYLFERNCIDHIKGIKDRSTGEDRVKAAYLLKFCTEGYMERQVKELVDRIAEEEAQAKIDIEGSEVPFRYSEILLTNEPDRAKRREIERKRNEKIAVSFNDVLYKYWDTLHSQARDLGFPSYRELFSYLKQQDFIDLKIEMEELLDQTRDLYQKHFGKLLEKELGISLKDSARSDFAFIKRAKKYDCFFKKDILIPVFMDTISGLGIDLTRYDNIHLDLEERENKSPRAFCSAPRIPEEIYLVVMPCGGQDDFEAVFHEGGHSLHFGNTSKRLGFEYRYLGDNTVTEGYAFCLEQLMQNSKWLVDFLNMSPDEAGEFVYFSSLIKLWFCRRYAGKLKYELTLHDGSPIDEKDLIYRQILSSANLMEYPEETYLKDVDEGFYCTNYIRAWIFQSQLEEYIYKKFGRDWYKKKKAGSFLKELWHYGQKYSPEGILSQLGFDRMNIDYLIDKLTGVIRSYKNI